MDYLVTYMVSKIQAITTGLSFAIFVFCFSFFEFAVYYARNEIFVPKDQHNIITVIVLAIYYIYRVYYVIQFIRVFYTARKFFKSFKPKKKNPKPDSSPSAPTPEIVASYTPGNFRVAQTHDC